LFMSIVPDNAITRYEHNMRDHVRNNPRVRDRRDLHWFLQDGTWKNPYRPSKAVDVDYARFAAMGGVQ
jgi:hypothetical protein